MKKATVVILAVGLAIAILVVSGVLGDVIKMFSGGDRTEIHPIKGVYYIFADHYERDSNEAEVLADSAKQWINIDFLRIGDTTMNHFVGDHVSIQTKNHLIRIYENGKVFVDTNEVGEVSFQKINQNYYVSLQDLQGIDAFDAIGIRAIASGELLVYTHVDREGPLGALQPDAYAFESVEMLALSKKPRGMFDFGSEKAVATGKSPENASTKGYIYTVNVEEKEHLLFISADSESLFVGFVDKEQVQMPEKSNPTKTQKQTDDGTEGKRFQNLYLVWEAVYGTNPDVKELGEMPGLTVVSPTWYTLENSSGDMLSYAEQPYIDWANQKGYDLWPLITNDSAIDTTSAFLKNYDAQRKVIDYLVGEAIKHGYDGLNMDFEHMYLADRDRYSHFVNMLSRSLEGWGLVSSVDVNIMEGADNWSKCFDHEVLGKVTDLLIVMTYDEYHQGSDVPGPNASYNWVSYNMKEICKVVDPSKVVLGIPYYTRIWESDSNGTSSETVSVKGIETVLASYPFEITWDDLAKQRKATYIEGDKVIEMWVEEPDSLATKVKLVHELGLAGTAAWRRGFENEETWRAVDAVLNQR